jgi:Fe-S-cluster containining protein
MTLALSYTVVRELGHLIQLSPEHLVVKVQVGKVTETLVSNKSVKIGPSIFRKFICTTGCRACCRSFGPLTLDYVPGEMEWKRLPLEAKIQFEERSLWVDGDEKTFYSAIKPHSSCPLESPTGCDVWPNHPLACHASARIQISKYLDTTMVLKKKGFSRTWRWKEPAQCVYTEPHEWDPAELQRDLHILDRYDYWATYFGIPTYIPEIKKNLIDSYLAKNVIPFRKDLA